MTNHPIKILLVEDNPIASKIQSVMFELQQCVVVKAASAEEAMQKVSEDFDLIILDIGLPDKDGFELIADMRKKLDLSKTVVIMLSAHSQRDYIAQAKSLGIHSIWEKPLILEKAKTIIELAQTKRNSLSSA